MVTSWKTVIFTAVVGIFRVEWLLLTSEAVPERGVAKVADSCAGLRPTLDSVMVAVVYKNVTGSCLVSVVLSRGRVWKE
jgi:hypothetical protein